jgi:broad specificity phosphatase PhoE
MTVSIIYETHSTTIDNENGIATGWLPGELSEVGRRQAAELGDRYRNRDIAAVYTSDLDRAVATAEIAFGDGSDGRRLPIHLDQRLRECNYGDLNGASIEIVHAARAHHVHEPFPGGESYQNVVDRTQSLLNDLATEHPNDTVVLIGHSANRWALDVLLDNARLADLVGPAPFEWRPGWTYELVTSKGGE